MPNPEEPQTPEPAADRIHFDLGDEDNFTNRMAVANAIAEQIWREQQLVSTRMTWNFTFQTFLAGIYVYAGANLAGAASISVQCTLALIGFLVTLFSLFGVVAAQKQSDRLKRHWVHEFCRSRDTKPGDCDISRGCFPQPFSTTKGSKTGRYASRGICALLMLMWVLMLSITLAVTYVFSKPTPYAKLTCVAEAAKPLCQF